MGLGSPTFLGTGLVQVPPTLQEDIYRALALAGTPRRMPFDESTWIPCVNQTLNLTCPVLYTDGWGGF